MGRWGGRERFEKMIERIRADDPLAALRATFIVGFPGETDADGDLVASFVEDNDLDWVGVFTYSREEGTRSHDLPDQVPGPLARERFERVSRAAEATMQRRAEQLVGTTLEVLAERLDVHEGVWTGRSHREAPEVDGEIRWPAGDQIAVGNYVPIRVTRCAGADLEGELQRGG